MSLAILSVVAYLVMIVSNILANALPIGGLNTGQISERFANSFVPAGYAFAIWGLIYLLLALFVVSRFTKAELEAARAKPVNLFFIISSLANAAWIFAWHHLQILFSMMLMLLILASLIHIYRMVATLELPRRRALFIKLPFQVYLGWISVATIANLNALIVASGWSPFASIDRYWAALMVLVAGAVAGKVHLLYRDYAFPLVVTWAAVGIFVRQQLQPESAFIVLEIASLAVPAALVLLLIQSSVKPNNSSTS